MRGLQVTKTLVDGAYSVKATKDLDEREVPVHCLIHCEISLPNTGYSVTEKIPHIRGERPLIHCENTLSKTGHSVTERMLHIRGQGPPVHCKITLPNTGSQSLRKYPVSEVRDH